jgi:serine/threonine protein kinase
MDEFLSQLQDYKDIINENASKHADSLTKKEDIQLKLEQKYLDENSKACHFTQAIQINSYDKKKLHKLLSEQFYNPDLLDMVSCMVDYIALIPDYDQLAGRQMRIRNLITDLRTLASGTYGQVFEAGLLHGSKDFIIKVPRGRYGDLLHEYFVGRFLNELRGTISNFAYTYAGFTCSPPILTNNLGGINIPTINWCARKPGVQYIVQERIPGKAMRQLLSKISPNVFMQIFLQIILSLAEAHKRFGFTHYDLHGGNVILRDTGTPISMAFPSPSGEIYITSQYVATIIDFGNAFIKVNINGEKQTFGKHFLEHYGITRRSFPLYDIFTFMSDAYYAAPHLRATIAPLYEYFELFDLKSAFQKEPLGNIFLPPIEPWIDETHWDFLHFLRNKLPDLYAATVTTRPVTDKLSCQDLSCFTNQQLVGQLNIPVTAHDNIDNILDLYDLTTIYPDREKYWLSKFDKEKGYQQLQDMYDTNFDLFEGLTRNPFVHVHFDRIAADDLYNRELQHSYFLYLQNLAQLTEVLDNLQMIRQIYKQFYPKHVPEFLTEDLDRIQMYHNEALNGVEEDYNILDNFINSPGYVPNQQFKNFYLFVKAFHYQTEPVEAEQQYV